MGSCDPLLPFVLRLLPLQSLALIRQQAPRRIEVEAHHGDYEREHQADDETLFKTERTAFTQFGKQSFHRAFRVGDREGSVEKVVRRAARCLLSVWLTRAHTEGTYLPAGHYPRGPLHVPTTQQGADTPTHPAGTGMGRARAMAISHPHTRPPGAKV